MTDLKGNLTSSNWAKIVKCSHDTVIRDIQALPEEGVWVRDIAGGSSTNYLLTI